MPGGPALAGLSRVVGWLTGLAMGLAALALLASLALIGWAVVMRYAFNAAPGWVDDFVGFSLVAIVLLAAAQTLRKGEHIGVDLLVERLGPAGRRWAQAWGGVCRHADGRCAGLERVGNGHARAHVGPGDRGQPGVADLDGDVADAGGWHAAVAGRSGVAVARGGRRERAG